MISFVLGIYIALLLAHSPKSCDIQPTSENSREVIDSPKRSDSKWM
jgi:hypothetical protein